MLIPRRFTLGIIPVGERYMDAAFLSSIMLDPTAPHWTLGMQEEIPLFTIYLSHYRCDVLGTLSSGASTVAWVTRAFAARL